MTLSEPLRFRPCPVEKVWGGRHLETFLEDGLSVEGPVGEVWSLFDREGASSEVLEGTYAGRSLGGLMLSERESLLGRGAPSADGHFPLLVKYLDAAAPLSIQVHPDRKAAARLGSDSKEECWYVLSAEPRAELYLGLQRDVNATAFAAASGSPQVLDLLAAHPVKPGCFVHVPAGTVHGIGPGVTLVEVQENADTTYRIFDWERLGIDGEPRELHPEEALKSIDYDPVLEGPVEPQLEDVGGANRSASLLVGDSFGVELLGIHEPLEHDTAGRAWVYVVISGSGSLMVPATGGTWRVRRGQTWLAPASLGVHRFAAVDGELEVLRIEARAGADS